ncbi:hypothetical protein M0802_012299 [Mischocyttarus mexicanus]|nr:hypothetical protein M0802_012299 [Mischocyttarus mexicanus]
MPMSHATGSPFPVNHTTRPDTFRSSKTGTSKRKKNKDDGTNSTTTRLSVSLAAGLKKWPRSWETEQALGVPQAPRDAYSFYKGLWPYS